MKMLDTFVAGRTLFTRTLSASGASLRSMFYENWP